MNGITAFTVDITTLALARGIVQMMLGGLLLYLGCRHSDARDARWWAIGFFVNGLSLFVFPFALPAAWEPPRVILNHLTLGASSLFFLIGFWKFGQQPVRPWLLVLLMLFPIVSLTAWEYLWPNARYRILFTAAGQILYLFLLQHSLSHPPREEIARLYKRLRYAVVVYILVYIWSYASIAEILPTTARLTLGYHRSIFSVASLLYMLTLAVGCLALQFAMLAARNADLARIDWLTGLLNRRGFFNALQLKQQGQRNHSPTSIVAIDIDHFKSINDRYGHACGDLVLQDFSQQLQAHAGNGRLIARMGGEEFLIVMDEDLNAAATLAEEIRKALEQRSLVTSDGMTLRVTVSIGIHQVNTAESIEKALINADQALYTAKENGRNQVVCWSFRDLPADQRHYRADSRMRAHQPQNS
ncbi:GGDEF domain-containing protein [Bowmanella denitrificans]|uniref:GGDEF domain-containing protein n=1 Tax=Bowmanella denitrificans TaxID=366582 RepID=UPI000C9B6F0D|nr:GGDEF domain-containing protein [Bowmanella denitrificans]